MISAVALVSVPTNAQSYSIPLSNGSFAVTNTGAGNQYVGPITFLSPAGSVNITGASPTILFQPNVPVTTNTPLGLVLQQVNGSVGLNDGRTATFTGGIAGLETEATITGAATWTPSQAGYFAEATVPVNSTVNFAVRNGYLTFAEAALSAYPVPQFEIPVTGGNFVINAPAGAGPETMTISGLLTPVGTANLTISTPIVVNPNNWYPLTLLNVAPPGVPVLVGGIANGTVALNDGRQATLNNASFLLRGIARVTTGSEYTLPEVFTDAKVITGQLNADGVINVPATAVGIPQPPVQPPVVRPEPVVPGAPQGGQGGQGGPGAQGVPAPVLEVPSPVSDRPLPGKPTTLPSEVAGLASTDLVAGVELSFAETVSVGGEAEAFAYLNRPEPDANNLTEEEGSPLTTSRIHGGLYSR